MYKWERAVCPLCGEKKPERILYQFNKKAGRIPFPDNLYLGDNFIKKTQLKQKPPKQSQRKQSFLKQYQIVKCSKCPMIYLGIRPVETDMISLYKTDDYFNTSSSVGYKSYDDQKITLKRTYARYLKTLIQFGLLNKSKNRNSMADIGCGKGYLLQEASSFFKITAGTDLSSDAVDIASKSCNFAICGGPEALFDLKSKDKDKNENENENENENGNFDLITAVSVLEHIYKPVDFMKQSRLLLDKQGIFSVVVPWFGGFYQKIMGKNWSSFILPEHIAYYNRQSLQLLGNKSGLKLIGTLPYHHYFPISLVLSKLGVKLHDNYIQKIKRYHIFLPSVMINAIYKKV